MIIFFWKISTINYHMRDTNFLKFSLNSSYVTKPSSAAASLIAFSTSTPLKRKTNSWTKVWCTNISATAEEELVTCKDIIYLSRINWWYFLPYLSCTPSVPLTLLTPVLKKSDIWKSTFLFIDSAFTTAYVSLMIAKNIF